MYSYTPSGVCSKNIQFDVVDGVVHGVHYDGGCNGNGKGISALCEGRKVDELIRVLDGLECKDRGTSCPAQLAQALKAFKEGKIEKTA